MRFSDRNRAMKRAGLVIALLAASFSLPASAEQNNEQIEQQLHNPQGRGQPVYPQAGRPQAAPPQIAPQARQPVPQPQYRPQPQAQQPQYRGPAVAQERGRLPP